MHSDTTASSLQIAGSNSKLILDGLNSSATSATFLGTNGTLDVAGSLTLTDAFAVGTNSLLVGQVNGGGVINAASLTALNGVSLAGGTILGAGTISGTLSGAGVLNAVGSLTVQNSSTISTLQIGIAGDPQLSSLVLNAASSATSLSFANASGGMLQVNTAGSLTLTDALAIGAARSSSTAAVSPIHLDCRRGWGDEWSDSGPLVTVRS